MLKNSLPPQLELLQFTGIKWWKSMRQRADINHPRINILRDGINI